MEDNKKVQAKVRCNSNTPAPWTGDAKVTTMIVRFSPVYAEDKTHPNYEWSQATPSGYIELSITNPAAFLRFEVGKEYLLTFEEV